jgi:pimeloyl-ACP methyl ester carboxylesterase
VATRRSAEPGGCPSQRAAYAARVDWSQTHYAKSADLHVAYQVLGDGELDLLILPYGLNVSIDAHDEEPHWNRFERRLGSFTRAIRFDPRGLGLSDPFEAGSALSIEQWAQDAIAVLDAVGSTRAALFATGGGGLVALMLCAAHPERTTAQVLTHCFARARHTSSWPRVLGHPHCPGGAPVSVDWYAASRPAGSGCARWLAADEGCARCRRMGSLAEQGPRRA